MFDLETAISDWRRSFTELVRAEDRDELEEHLRCDVSSLTATGLNEQECFLVARHRIGASESLERELAKVHLESLWISRVEWMLLGFLGINALLVGLQLASSLASWGASAMGLGAAAALGAYFVAQVLGFVLLALSFTTVARNRVSQQRSLVLPCLLLAVATPLLMLGLAFVTIGQTRNMGVEDWSTVAFYQSVARSLAAIALPLALFTAVYMLERKRRLA